MTNISRNVLNVIHCIDRCTEHKLALSELGRLHAGEDAVLQRAQDMLLDMEIELCKLAASLVTAPISGRMLVKRRPEQRHWHLQNQTRLLSAKPRTHSENTQIDPFCLPKR
jgi:hypothetical protein